MVCERRTDHQELLEEEHGIEERGESVYLPEALVIESILTRLPAQTLAVCCCVNKSWYNSILNDPWFSREHYNQNKHKRFLVFTLLNVSRDGMKSTSWYSLSGRDENTSMRYLSGKSVRGMSELVGFCNGLVCMKLTGAYTDPRGAVTIFNPIRAESLVLPCVLPSAQEYMYLCHGFGFDSLSQVYKAVIVFASKADDGFLCMVITLGTMSWRKILTSSFDISLPEGISDPPGLMVTRVMTTLWKQSTYCGGDLFWRKNIVGDNNDKIELLLSFDLHNEKIQFIRLPPNECTPTTYESQCLVVDHLLEFKGYPCIARYERTTRTDNGHCGHRCDYQTGVCCCCYKVHMYVLKNKDKQVWTREEAFDVQIMGQEGSLPTPLCRYFDSTSTVMPPTRMLTLSDQVLLYWFNGIRLVFYNLQEKHLTVVECSRAYPGVFRLKMNDNLERRISHGDNIDCPSMDYQLHAQVENMVSLKTFIPKEAKTSESGRADDLMPFLDKKLAAGWLSMGGTKKTFLVFF